MPGLGSTDLDQSTDVAMGICNGCRTILVRTGFAGRDGKVAAKPDLIVADISEAADRILGKGAG